jgi:hypothetical protein
MDKPVLAIDDIFMLPMAAMPYHDVRINAPYPSHIVAVFIHLDRATRDWVANRDWDLTCYCIKRGQFVPIGLPGADIPPHHTLHWKEMVKHKKKWLAPLLEELMKRAWHPSRLAQCLDIDDGFILVSKTRESDSVYSI